MRRRSVIILLLLALIASLPACNQPLTVEQRIIATIREMEAKIEAGERRRFMSHVAEDFSGQHGMNRDQARALVVFQLNRHKQLHAQLFPIHVSEQGDELASARFRALVTGGPGWIPESGQLYDFDTHWRLQDDEWLLVKANWTPVPLEDAL